MSRPLINVVDVYEMATDISKEIEGLIDLYGSDAVTNLIPKVINSLELLESFAVLSEEENTQIDDLRTRVTQLEVEKRGKAEDRVKYEKELEQIEENLREENRDLIGFVSRLQEENRKLSSALATKEGPAFGDIGCTQEQDILLLQKMKVVLETQRKQLRAREQELQQATVDLETAKSQVEKLTQVKEELHRKQRNSQLQARALIEEKAEMQGQLQDQQRELHALRETLGASRKTNEDLRRMKSPTMPNLSNKVVYDLDDPDRPRFTMNELRKILFERNELKAKVSELQDELEMYRPKPSSPQSSVSEDDAPVQGPINRDPDDAPWKRQESGIRKLFRVLFGESSDSSPSGKSSGSSSAMTSPVSAKFTSSPEPRAFLH